jgi:hypothetical protein
MSTIAELVDIVVTQCTDMIQAIDLVQNHYSYGTGTLVAGTHFLAFNTEGTLAGTTSNEYGTGESWHFLIKEAIDTGGFDIGCVVSARTATGFTVTVDDDCTFTYETVFRKSWISD